MNDFDHRPDPVLGEALRDALSAGDDAEFARRVMARVPQVIAAESWWDVLGGWARPGVAAAAAVLVAVALWMAGHQAGTAPVIAVEEPAAASEPLSAGTLLVSQALPEFEVEMVLGEERVNE